MMQRIRTRKGKEKKRKIGTDTDKALPDHHKQ